MKFVFNFAVSIDFFIQKSFIVQKRVFLRIEFDRGRVINDYNLSTRKNIIRFLECSHAITHSRGMVFTKITLLPTVILATGEGINVMDGFAMNRATSVPKSILR